MRIDEVHVSVIEVTSVDVGAASITVVEVDQADPDLLSLLQAGTWARIEIRVNDLPPGSPAFHAFWNLQALNLLNAPFGEILDSLEERDLRYLREIGCIYLWQVMQLTRIASDRVRERVLEDCDHLNRARPKEAVRFGLGMDLTPFRGRLAE